MNTTIKSLSAFLAIIVASALGCGAPEENVATDLGELEQEIEVQPGFGVKSSGSTKDYTCTTDWGGLCYYGAPGEDGVARVRLDTTGMTASEIAEWSATLDLVIAELNEGQQAFSGPPSWQPPYGFVRWTGAAASARVIVRKGQTGCDAGLCLQNIDAYVDPVCTAHNPLLTESPVALAGTHRVCTHWTVTVDGVDLNEIASPTSRTRVREHAIANGLLATRGSGRTNIQGVWDGDNVESVINAPLIYTFPMSAISACRAHYYDYTGSTISRDPSFCNF